MLQSAPEVEEALTSLVWHYPQHLGELLRHLDPETHFAVPAMRWMIEAIGIGYRELACVDFCTIVQILREMGKLEECGGRPVLLTIYMYRDHFECLLDYYIELLKDYATQRSVDPYRPVKYFTG